MIEIFASIILAAGSAETKVPPPEWSKVAAAARSYQREASDENAARLYRLVPTRELSISERPDDSTRRLLYSLVPDLERRMFYGDLWSTRLAFRLLNAADAAFSEDLGAALGSLATNRPELFLRELELEGGSCYLITMFNPDYDERWIKSERRLPIARLRETAPTSLEPRRRECLRLLLSDHDAEAR